MKISGILAALSLLASALPGFAQTGEPSPAVTTGLGASPQALTESVDLFARDSYRIDTLVCPFGDRIDYEPGEIECGLLEVPENRENPNSRMIELHFVKLNSRWDSENDDASSEGDTGVAPGKRDDPVIYLTGGPGSRVTYYVKRFKDHTLLDHRDLYILEQRGIGFSDDFCPFYGTRNPSVGDVETFEENLESGFTRKAMCATNARAAGVDLAAYHTIENARDVKALRRALGFEQWNVWGISYGSILGQAYVKEDPEGILAVALDAIMPLDIRESELFWRVAHWYNRDLVKLQEICDRQPECAKLYPDIGGRLRQAIRSVLDDPIEVDTEDIENFPSGKVRFFQDVVAFLPFLFLYEQDNYPGLPGLVYAWADAVESRDEKMFKGLAAAAGDSGFLDSSDGMRDAIFCLDGDAEAQARAGRKDIQEYPILGAAIGTEKSYRRSVALCAELGLPQRPTGEFTAVQTSIPALIIEGDMDPITPPPNAKAILPGFENGTYVEFPFAGHGPSRSVDCAGHMLNKFYDDPAATPDLDCASSMEEPVIWTPMYVTRIVPRLLELMAGDGKRLALPALWAGSSLLVVLIAFIHLSFAPLVRSLSGAQADDTAGARFNAWLAATLCVAAVATLVAAMAVTVDTSELLPLFGMVPWAVYGAWLGFLAGIMGLVALLSIVRAHRAYPLPFGTLAGLTLTAVAAIGMSAFLLSWELGPF